MQRALPNAGFLLLLPPPTLALAHETIREARTAFGSLHDERAVLLAGAALSERLRSPVTPFRERTTRPIMVTDPEMP